MYMASFTFLLAHCGSLVSTLVLSSETECPVVLQWSPTPVGTVRLVCSLKRFPSGCLVSPMYHQFLLSEQFQRKKTSRDQGF